MIAEALITSNKVVEFIFQEAGYFRFLHTTNTIEKAKSICENGFWYKNFNKTTDYVCDPVSLAYMLNIRKYYGDFTLIIQLCKNICSYEKISKMEYDEEGDEVFILPPQYIKGVYDRRTNEIYANPLFNIENTSIANILSTF